MGRRLLGYGERTIHSERYTHTQKKTPKGQYDPGSTAPRDLNEYAPKTDNTTKQPEWHSVGIVWKTYFGVCGVHTRVINISTSGRVGAEAQGRLGRCAAECRSVLPTNQPSGETAIFYTPLHGYITGITPPPSLPLSHSLSLPPYRLVQAPLGQ